MCGSHRTEVGGPFDQFLHLLPGFLVSLLPLGILQSVTDSHLVDVGDVGTEDFILTAQFVHLELEFAPCFSACSRAVRR